MTEGKNGSRPPSWGSLGCEKDKKHRKHQGKGKKGEEKLPLEKGASGEDGSRRITRGGEWLFSFRGGPENDHQRQNMVAVRRKKPLSTLFKSRKRTFFPAQEREVQNGSKL